MTDIADDVKAILAKVQQPVTVDLSPLDAKFDALTAAIADVKAQLLPTT